VESSADRVLVVANPGAGRRPSDRAVEEMAACLSAGGMKTEVITDLEGLAPLVSRYQADGSLRAVVAAGGDGTVAEIANRTTPETPLAVFPLGTANLLAGYLAIPQDAGGMARLLREGTTVRLDAGRANGRVFLLMAGCGFDADVVHRMHRRRRTGHISYWSWAQPILESIRRYPFHDLRVYCDSADRPVHSARWAFVVNLPVYAAGLNVAPAASGTDGMFDVCTFARGSFWHGLRYVGHVMMGRHQKLSDFKLARARRVRIESDAPVPYQLDGDPGGTLPLEIEMLPGRVTLWVPRARAAELGFEGSALRRAGV
jgi:YegS/Rv2252/BmrU family lipid kinase